MSKIKIMTDSACDISAELEKELDIMIVPFKIAMGDKSYTSRVDFDNEQFYDMLDSYDGIPATSQITAFEFGEIYENLYNQGYTDVIYTSINSKGSATYNNSVMATNEFFENHPDAKDKFNIYTLDSKTYSGGYGYPVIEAGKKAKKGQSAKSIVSFLKDWFDNGVTYFGMYTLQYAKKSGRIPSAAAFVGEVMGLRPIMKIENNEIVTANKVRGDKAIIPKILECCEKEMIPKTPYCVMYGSDKAVGDEMAQAMTKAVGYPPSEMIQIGAAIAINAGPKVVSVVIKAQKQICTENTVKKQCKTLDFFGAILYNKL